MYKTIDICTEDGIYEVREDFINELNRIANSKFSLLGRKFKLTDEIIVRLAIEEDMVIGRRDNDRN
jgi:hypothetical protein